MCLDNSVSAIYGRLLSGGRRTVALMDATEELRWKYILIPHSTWRPAETRLRWYVRGLKALTTSSYKSVVEELEFWNR